VVEVKAGYVAGIGEYSRARPSTVTRTPPALPSVRRNPSRASIQYWLKVQRRVNNLRFREGESLPPLESVFIEGLE
jgi:hypothetical protein